MLFTRSETGLEASVMFISLSLSLSLSPRAYLFFIPNRIMIFFHWRSSVVRSRFTASDFNMALFKVSHSAYAMGKQREWRISEIIRKSDQA